MADWHYRLGHPSTSILKSIVSNFSLPSTQSVLSNSLCTDCSINKSHKLPFHQSTILSTRPLEYIFTDVWSSPITSCDNYKYYLILVDHYTRYTWLYPLKTKSQVRDTFIPFKELVENRFNTRIGTLYSDNGGEFLALKSFLSSAGISHYTSPPHTPEHNGISERKHRHVVETGLSLLTHAGMPKSYWTYAFATATYLINRLPSPVLNMDSPFNKLFGETPNYNKLRIFGCLCFPWLRPYNANKLENKSSPCVFLGYSQTQSAFLCLQPTTGRIYVSRHVKFDETQFPFQALRKIDNSPASSPSATKPPVEVITLRQPLTPPSIAFPTGPSTSAPHQTTSPENRGTPLLSPSSETGHRDAPPPILDNTISNPPTQPNISPQAQNETNTQGPLNQSPHNTPPIIQPTNTPPPIPIAEPPSSPPQHPPPPNPPPGHQMQTRNKNNIRKPNPKYNLMSSLKSSIPPEPLTVTQALKDERWRGAMSEEVDAFAINQTFDLVPRPPRKNVVGCKWVYKNKFLPSGAHNRCKARLVAKGYNQQLGRDYTDTFSPVIKSTTIRLVLDIAITRGWPIQQLDVNNAFLQGTLNEEVYMEQPPGFIDLDKRDYVCRLRKAIYGLKQAPRAWYTELKTYLLSVGFQNSLSDTSLFTLRRETDWVYLLVYVDDILITGSDQSLITHILAQLAERFSVKDAEDLNYFLGIEAHRTPQGLHLSQRKYILDLLHRHAMLEAKPVTSPMASSPKLTINSGTTLPEPKEYRRLVGSLQYLAFTRPDIAYAVNRLSQFMHRPTDAHWQAAKRVLRYLAGTSTHGIFFSAANNLSLHAFSDSDWAGDSDDYVSTNSYIIYLGKHPISWSAKKQNGVSRSSTEAEYRAVANGAAEIRWICNILTELGVILPAKPVIYCDNVGATFLCANPVFHSRMKHIAIDYHFIRGHIQQGILRVAHVNTKDQLADALTKPLPRTRFLELRDKIGVVSPLHLEGACKGDDKEIA